MAKFKEGDAVYHIVGNQAFKKTIIKVLDQKFFTPQRYIVEGGGVAGLLVGAMYGAADDVAAESDLTERVVKEDTDKES